MITIEIMGGLGNQLFQIACLLSYSLKYKIPFYFERVPTKKIDRPLYWDNLFKSLKPFLKEPMQLPIYKEPHYHYSKLPYIEESFKLLGYFQSYKYFSENEESIFRLLRIRESQALFKETSVSLHFRIGDYKDLQEHHPLLSIDYYVKALDQLIKDTGKDDWNVIYFFEKKDTTLVKEHIEKLKKYNLTFEPIDHCLSDWQQMLKMSVCKHNIIANSSFSWWGAYLNQSSPKVYYPKVWFGPAQGIKQMEDLCPPTWTIIH